MKPKTGIDDDAQRPPATRHCLLRSPVALIEDLRNHAASPKTPEAWCDVYQVCLPYHGFFVWHVAGDKVAGDPNQVVFVRAGEPFSMSSANRTGYREVVITPSIEAISEIAHSRGLPLGRHPLFQQRACPATPELHLLRGRLLQGSSTHATGAEPLEIEETALRILRTSFQLAENGYAAGGAKTRQLIQRTKEFLAAEFQNAIGLADIGRSVGASPTYLTDAFRRMEGQSLHRYIVRLRLSRALTELPHTPDLTQLALDLGFSSHSHFALAFRKAFGCTPSNFRDGGFGTGREH